MRLRFSDKSCDPKEEIEKTRLPYLSFGGQLYKQQYKRK